MAFADLPLRFEPNVGQADARVNFLTRNRRYTLFLMPTEILITLNRNVDDRMPSKHRSHPDEQQPASSSTGLVRMHLEDANPRAEIKGRSRLPGTTNYFLGDDPSRWHVNIANYESVEYRDVYPGIQLVFYGRRGGLEFDFVVAADADPDIIRLSFEGIENMLLDDFGNLIADTSAGRLFLHKPFIYQENHGRRNPVAGSFVLDAVNHVRLQVAAYDTGRPLVIDPPAAILNISGG
ncbi:MAG: hypothetical protein JSW26_26685 [Desulfobacterales bacterium]|nr:MAG: hypothetical protein JSW26_26685 [Desulfobacterales bacterium]